MTSCCRSTASSSLTRNKTRYYLDPNTGALLQRADATGRWPQWLFSGLHRLDFAEWMRTRPFRDIGASRRKNPAAMPPCG
jgi:hypothetical protein